MSLTNQILFFIPFHLHLPTTPIPGTAPYNRMAKKILSRRIKLDQGTDTPPEPAPSLPGLNLCQEMPRDKLLQASSLTTLPGLPRCSVSLHRLRDTPTDVKSLRHRKREKSLDIKATKKKASQIRKRGRLQDTGAKPKVKIPPPSKRKSAANSQVTSESPKKDITIQELLATHATHCESHEDSSDVEFISETKQADPPVAMGSAILPLVPDFTGYLRNPDVDISTLNLSTADKERTLSELSAQSSSKLPRSMGQCLPKDIRDKMWPVSTDSDSFRNSNTDSSDAEKPVQDIKPPPDPFRNPNTYSSEAAKPALTIQPHTGSDAWAATMKHNLTILKRKPMDTDRLSSFREAVRVGLGNMAIAEPPIKKVKIEKIMWDTQRETASEEKEDSCDILSRKIKRLRVFSDQSSEDQSPVKRRLGWRDIPHTDQSPEVKSHVKSRLGWTHNTTPPVDSSAMAPPRRVIKIATRKSPPNTVPVKNEVECPPDRPILTASRKGSAYRICRICGSKEKNLRSHVGLEHLGSIWWGVIGDLTCWNCQRYHTPSEITRCEGSYVPLFHKDTLIERHKDFINYLMEEFGVQTPRAVLHKVKELGLHTKCGSDFTERETIFLETIDQHYGSAPKSRYSARHPNRVVELLHWKTISEIFCYLKEAGRIIGSRSCTHSASVVDTRCDIITLYSQENHKGSLSSLELIQKDLRDTKVNMVIAEVHDPATPIEDMMLIMKDPMIRLAVGVSPQNAHQVKAGYYVFCKLQIKRNNLVAIGGLGLDSRLMSSSLGKQKQVMSEFMQLAKESNKAVRLLSTGDFHRTINLAKETLLKKHPVHVLNYNGGPEEIQDFLNHFDNGFIGISCKVADPSPRLLRTIQKTPITRLVVESNCPHQVVTYHATPRPTDVSTVLNIVARIKCLSPILVSRIIRSNITKLYHM